MDWPFVRTMIARDVVESTSDLARELVAEDSDDLPLAVWAARQTRGRGRGENSWWSDAGSLTFTIAIDPASHGIGVEQESRLALATAVAVIDAVAATAPGVSPGIRWPNDVEVDGRKLGGILPERVMTPRGPRILIGIGLNVATRLGDAPAEVGRMAVALTQLRESPPTRDDLESLLRAILDRIGAILPRLADDDLHLAECWDRLDTLRDRKVRVDLGPRIVAGTGRGIDATGALCLAVDREIVRIVGGRVLREPGIETGRV
jgi:BirA family biotin operon repressor/biotin-[acetyl-CoA-carboxylase] ligase